MHPYKITKWRSIISFSILIIVVSYGCAHQESINRDREIPLAKQGMITSRSAIQDVIDEAKGIVTAKKGTIVITERKISRFTFPIVLNVVGVDYGTKDCFAMIIYKGDKVAIYRITMVDPFSPFIEYYRMKSKKIPEAEILKATGISNTPQGWVILNDPPEKYWRRLFFPWNGESPVPFRRIDHKSQTLVFDGYSTLTKERITNKEISSLLLGIAPKGEIQQLNLTNAYIVKILLK